MGGYVIWRSWWKAGRILAVLAFLAVAGLAAPGGALAELPAPNFMPGFPMVAGPQAIIMWQPVPGADRYRVYLDGKMVAEMAAFQYMAELPKEGDHAYKVVAVGKDGKEGAPSKEFKYAVQKLAKPKGLSWLPKGNAAAVRWESVPTAIIYDLHRATKPDGPYELLTSSQDVVYTDSSVKPGQDYYYKIAAKNPAGAVSDFSDPIKVSLDAPEARKEEKKVLPVRSRLIWTKKEMEDTVEPLVLKDGSVAVSLAATGGRSVVEIFDRDGNRKATVSPPKGKELATIFYGMGPSRDGNVWVVNHLGSSLYQFNPASGDIVKEIEIEPLPGTQTPYRLFDVAEADDGRLYVTEQKNSFVLVLKGNKIVGNFGKPGWKDGEMISPLFLELLKNELFLVDGGNNRVEVFDLEGKFLRTFGKKGGAEAGTFMRISGLSIDPVGGKVYVADRATSNISIFEPSGAFYGAMANEDGTGQMPTLPVGINVRGKDFAVAVPMGQAVQMFGVLGPKAP